MRYCAVAFAALLAGCQADQVDTSRVWRVNEVIAKIDALNGQTIKVAGYLGGCEGYDCGFFQDKNHLDATDRWLAGLRKGHRGSHPGDWLGIGGFPEFDRQAKPFNHSYVLLTAKVSNHCRFDGKPACGDRADDLTPVSIAAWNPKSGKSQ